MVLPPPRNKEHVTDYARAINGCFVNTPHVLSTYINLAIRIPLYDVTHLLAAANGTNEVAPKMSRPPTEADLTEIYQMWDTIRTICGYNAKLSICESTLPMPCTQSEELSQCSTYRIPFRQRRRC